MKNVSGEHYKSLIESNAFYRAERFDDVTAGIERALAASGRAGRRARACRREVVGEVDGRAAERVADAVVTAVRWARRSAVIGAFVFLVVVWIAMPWVSGDTPFVLDGSNAFLTCLSQPRLLGCGYTGAAELLGLDDFGRGLAADATHSRPDLDRSSERTATRRVTRVLELLSVTAVGATVVLAWIVLSTASASAAWFWAFMLVLLSSPLFWYARTTAAEALATGLLVCLCRRDRTAGSSRLVGLAAVGAAWTKETSYPFIVALGVLGLVLARTPDRESTSGLT